MNSEIEKIMLPNWYQFDVMIENGNRETFSTVLKLIEDLKSQNHLEKWFYLFEVPNEQNTIRVRFETSESETSIKQKLEELMKSNSLRFYSGGQYQFGPYWEDKKDHPTSEYLETFADVMSLITQMNVQKFQGKSAYPNFRFVEMYSHCIFNNTYHGLNTEGYFLIRRLSKVPEEVKDDPELTGIDDLKDKLIQIEGVNFPIKKSE